MTSNNKKIMRKVAIIGLLATMSVLPFISSAQLLVDNPVDSAIEALGIWVARLVILLVGVAVLIFMWGVIKFVAAAGDEEKRKEGKTFMLWGIIGIFVLVSVWALVRVLTGAISAGVGGLNFGGAPPPQVQQP